MALDIVGVRIYILGLGQNGNHFADDMFKHDTCMIQWKMWQTHFTYQYKLKNMCLQFKKKNKTNNIISQTACITENLATKAYNLTIRSDANDHNSNINTKLMERFQKVSIPENVVGIIFVLLPAHWLPKICVYTFRPRRQYGRHFPDDIFK